MYYKDIKEGFYFKYKDSIFQKINEKEALLIESKNFINDLINTKMFIGNVEVKKEYKHLYQLKDRIKEVNNTEEFNLI